jgi:hypothetical protein
LRTANKSNEFLIDRIDPNYPPHHKGNHLEESFIKFWESEGRGNRKLIPVHWTAVYNHRVKEGLGPGTPNSQLRNQLSEYLRSLNPDDKYFIVCTHDDAPAELLPPDTLVFSAGGNSKRIDISIPLTCGPHDGPGDHIRTIPLSFVGSLTHPLRYSMARTLQGKSGVFLNATEWSPEVPNDRVDLFKKVTQRSIFSLCPRGYGATSYRLYEAMQLGAVPVYVSDRHLLPWSDEIDWSEFCIVVDPDNIQNILEKTLGIPASKLRKMQEKLPVVWEKYFSIDATCENISKRVKA